MRTVKAVNLKVGMVIVERNGKIPVKHVNTQDSLCPKVHINWSMCYDREFPVEVQ